MNDNSERTDEVADSGLVAGGSSEVEGWIAGCSDTGDIDVCKLEESRMKALPERPAGSMTPWRKSFRASKSGLTLEIGSSNCK